MEEVKKQGMESLFCPYDLALELKELGFDEKCIGLWQSKYNSVPYLNINSVENIDTLLSGKIHNEDVNYIVKSPLWQQAFRFFREKYKLLSFVDIDSSYRIYCDDIKFDLDIDSRIFKTYEEAELECMVKLIDIAKEQNVK